MNTREHLLGHAIEVIESGSCVDIVGDRGSGRTRMLARVATHFLNRTWHVETVRCVSSLSSYPLLALAMAGVDAARESRVCSVPAVVAELAERLPRGRSVLLVDNWDDLDEVSWGAITTLQREHGVPFALTRVAGRPTASTPTGLRGSTSEPSFAIHLEPLRFDELDHAVADHLGGPVDPATSSLLYAKSGGNVGLALALADAGRWERSLLQLNDQWTAVRELGSDSLSLKLETLLEPLTPRDREILETLSHLGVAGVDTALRFAGADDLERLESRSLLEIFSDGSGYVIGVRPPLLAEYLRHPAAVARRLRILGSISDALEPGSPHAEPDPAPPATAAGFIRRVAERQRERVLATRDEWMRSGALEGAVAYLDSMVDASGTCIEIDAVFDDTADVTGPGDARIAWLLRWADHRAYSHGDPRSAVCRLRAEAAAHALGAILVARAVELETEMLAVPDPADLPDPGDHADPRVAAALLRARAYVHTTRGEFSLSTDALTERARIASPDGDHLIAALEAMNSLGRAAVPAVIAESSRRYAAAFAGFDPIALRCHAEILAFCAVIQGRYADVDRILDESLSLGHPSPRAPFAQLGLTVMAGVAASLRGQRESAQQRLDDAERLVTPDGSFPARVRGWADVAAQAGQGHADEAADAAARTGDRLWERGARFAAAAVYLTGLELVPDAGELDRVADRVRSIEGELIAAQFAYVRALVTRDPQAMSEAAAVLSDQKRFGMALAAYSAAADGFAELDDEESAARVSELRDRLESELPPGAYDAVRFEHRFEQLSPRELQISRLVAAGRSNREIADELFLSVRTVETHLLRVMRKARVATRHQLGGFLERIGHPAS